MSAYADEIAAVLAPANSQEFSPGELLVADTLLRLLLYPTMELMGQRGPEFRVVRKWPRQDKETMRVQFRHTTRASSLDELPNVVARFIRERFAHPVFAPFRRGMRTLLLRYAVLERRESGMRVHPVNEHFLEQGFALHTNVARHVGERLVSVTAQIPHDTPPLTPPEEEDRTLLLSGVQRWRGWAAMDLPRFLLGPLRFAPFTCCPPRECCFPNCKIVYSSENRPLVASLVVTRDIAAGGLIVVEWSDVHLLLSSSPLACCVTID